MKPTVAVIDLAAIANNINVFRTLNPNRKICAVVKANAYGHGIVQVAKHAVKNGADFLAIAQAEEAVPLRQNGIKQPIIVLGASLDSQIKLAVSFNLQITVFNLETLHEIEKYVSADAPAKVHIKIDTGMGRIGVCTEDELNILLNYIANSKKLELAGVYTHFSKADYTDKSYTNTQYWKFKNMLRIISERGFKPPVHCHNSAAGLSLPHFDGDFIRLGIAMYGLNPSGEVTNASLIPALTLKTKVVHVKTISAGSRVSYGGTFITKRETRVATVPIGYGDGYFRCLSNKAHMLINGKRVPIIGRVCMDQIMLDVTEAGEVNLGDEVVVIGMQGNEYISADELAELAGTINYEIVTALMPRIERIYIGGE